MKKLSLGLILAMFVIPFSVRAERGAFDVDRWYNIIDSVKQKAASQGISENVINQTVKSIGFIPSIIKSDKNQSEFKLTLQQYLDRTVSDKRITQGRSMKQKYPTMLSKVEAKYGLQPHVILAFWGMESNYGAVKSKHKLTDAFFTLMYDGRRETFFTNQLIALMKIADKNKLDINDIHGSWAGAMGHFQFIPTTLSQYGVDSNGDGRIDIINSIGDAMYSAGNYLNKLGWNPNERIVRRVILPADFDITMLDGKTKLTLPQWTALGVVNPDGTPIPSIEMIAGLVTDVADIEAQRNTSKTEAEQSEMDADVAPAPVIEAYLTYPNFYRIKKWNNSNWYAIAIANLADQLK
ncbi:MAG: lytic murein transglycosylase [Alphaproteobacteria bacterium]|nr:lytic murein transglycosylase [Alphaproteobacteria bacterium]